ASVSFLHGCRGGPGRDALEFYQPGFTTGPDSLTQLPRSPGGRAGAGGLRLCLPDAAAGPEPSRPLSRAVAPDGTAVTAPTALVFGGSGQIGAALLARLAAGGWDVAAVSRHARASDGAVRWLRGELSRPPPLPRACDAVFSAGPLDLFAAWYAGSGIECGRVLAFGSTSMHAKRAAADDGERALAARLHQAEERLFQAAAERGAAATVLRPTLVYGAGRDQSLTRIARLASRAGFFPLPRGADGL